MRVCAWCRRPMPATSSSGRSARRDGRFCRQACRQAEHRFRRGLVERERAALPMRFAYADPPYPEKAELYRDHPDYAGEVDHVELVDRLVDGYPDGWALSTSAAALPDVLRLCPTDVRVCSWHRGVRGGPAHFPTTSWEPVIVRGGRPDLDDRFGLRADSLVYPGGKTRTTDPGRVIGAKPAAFVWWLFDLLGALPGDALDDLFPGSGGVGRAWELYAAAGGVAEISTRQIGVSS